MAPPGSGDNIRLGIDFAAVSAVTAAFFQWLPTILAIIGSLFAILWYGIQIAESQTVRNWLAARRGRSRASRIKRLREKEAEIQAAIASLGSEQP